MKPNQLFSKITLALLLVALCGTSVARELRVPANGEYLIGEAEAELRVDRLISPSFDLPPVLDAGWLTRKPQISVAMCLLTAEV